MALPRKALDADLAGSLHLVETGQADCPRAQVWQERDEHGAVASCYFVFQDQHGLVHASALPFEDAREVAGALNPRRALEALGRGADLVTSESTPTCEDLARQFQVTGRLVNPMMVSWSERTVLGRLRRALGRSSSKLGF